VGATVFKTPDSTNLLVVTFAASFLLDLTTLYGAYFLGLGLYAEMVYQNILYVPLSRGLGLVLAYRGLGTLGIPLGWALGGLATLVFSLYLWKGKLSLSTSYPVRPLLAFSLPLFAATLISLLQNWGDITLLQGILGQFGTTGAYYIVVSSVAFLSILWTPIAGALYPSLSSSYHNQGPEAVSEKLATATRLINLTVLPTGAALAAIAPTALELVYGNTLGNQALPFAILSITIIFTAQSLLITTTLQAIGKTRQILWIGLTATIIDLGTVWFGAPVLGTTAGAIGRTLLALTTMLLAWVALRKNLQAFLAHGLPKALTLGTVSALPLFLIDTALTNTLHYAPLPRILLLVPIFFASYLAASRALSVFTPVDFDLMENALPKFLVGALRALERLVLPKTAS
jgi:O-antigen/teichoic acid export membrane protein